jgi:hypothetical protein
VEKELERNGITEYNYAKLKRKVENKKYSLRGRNYPKIENIQ